MTTTTAVTLEVPDLARVADVSDAVLIEWMQRWAAAGRRVDAGLARLSAEVDRRSSLELGYQGLAQRSGARTPDALVARVTGASAPEARTMVAVGVMLDAPSPWLVGVARRVESGDISIGAAAAIQQGLGSPSADVAADDLVDAATRLVDEVGGLSPERVARRAREVRDELDADGVADREAALRERRFLRLTPQADGMTRLYGLLDPESAALVTDAFDLVTAPRRGGPRFVDPTQKARAEAIATDSRSTEQLAVDAFVEMVRIAGAADQGTVFGTHKPGVRVTVALSDLDRRRGAVTIEGQPATVSVATAERRACADGYLPICFDDGRSLDLGRTQRLFSAKQRMVLAVKWGGCVVPDCDRPPSWTEAHHIEQWERGGRTDVDDGVLLCRHHHMMIHNRGWRIWRSDRRYFLDPPADDPLNRRVEVRPRV
jgi:hypothetical protein